MDVLFIPMLFTNGLSSIIFSNFMSIYIHVVILMFDGRGGDLLVISCLGFFPVLAKRHDDDDDVLQWSKVICSLI